MSFLSYYRQSALKENELNSRWIQVAYRFIGSAIAFSIKDTAIRPNHLTLANLLLGLIANILIGFNAFSGAIWLAIVLHQIAFVLDYADGSLARLQDQSSKFGSWFDANTDVLKDVTLIFATCWYAYATSQNMTSWILGFMLISVIYMTTKARDSYAKVASKTHSQSVGYRLKQRMVIVRQFHFTSSYLYIALPVAILLNLTTYGIGVVLIWSLISLLYTLSTITISLIKQDNRQSFTKIEKI